MQALSTPNGRTIILLLHYAKSKPGNLRNQPDQFPVASELALHPVPCKSIWHIPMKSSSLIKIVSTGSYTFLTERIGYDHKEPVNAPVVGRLRMVKTIPFFDR